ncbi:DinB family protein [Priestia megaterium]|uniref:DinB family protein n=1 Tax=Priestia megaterium TaxID=1404 RepID=UPI001FD5359A|nr:DinB family protein [Priestia megaterium]
MKVGVLMHQYEYTWVRKTRGTLLDFCKELEPNGLNQQNRFAWQSVRNTLVHIADCYYAWLGSFALLKTEKPLTPRKELHNFNFNKIKGRFEQVDSIVNDVYKLYGNKLNERIERKIPWREEPEIISITPNKLLMHTITHEFHHKGQIVSKLRMMGYEPPNTDILGTKD